MYVCTTMRSWSCKTLTPISALHCRHVGGHEPPGSLNERSPSAAAARADKPAGCHTFDGCKKKAPDEKRQCLVHADNTCCQS